MSRESLSLGRLLVLIMLVVPGTAAAQPVTANVRVTATVIDGLSVQGENDLDFGQIVASPTGATMRIGKENPAAGRFLVMGKESQEIQVTFEAPAQLARQDGNGTLPVTLDMFGAASDAEAAGAQQILQNDTVQLDDQGRYYFYVGGTLSIGSPTDNPPGTYTGDCELAVTYTSM